MWFWNNIVCKLFSIKAEADFVAVYTIKIKTKLKKRLSNQQESSKLNVLEDHLRVSSYFENNKSFIEIWIPKLYGCVYSLELTAFRILDLEPVDCLGFWIATTTIYYRRFKFRIIPIIIICACYFSLIRCRYNFLLDA